MLRTITRCLAAAALALCVLVAVHPAADAVSGTPHAVNGARISTRLVAAIGQLATRSPAATGYARDDFKLWDDVDGDCRDTRAEVLVAESSVPVTGGCTVRTGRWTPYYSGHRVYLRASNLDIDHLVPLAEVWVSGGAAWSSARREAYANDLTDFRTLIAVSAHDNRSKGDRDPAQWVPEHHVCRYVTQWVAVKLRWGLAADRAEKRALSRYAAGCPDKRIVSHRARVVGTTQGTGGSGGGTGQCTRTSSGSCIRAGEFCPQADYGQTGRDANGNTLVCTGDHTHPRWKSR